MKLRTKLRLKFYVSLVGMLLLTIVVGVFFQYVVWVAWQMHLGITVIKYEIFVAMAVILFLMCIADIVIFFRLILKRQYW